MRRLPYSNGVCISLTGRLLILVIFAVIPALVIQAWNEYDLRIARETDIRQQVILTTKQLGEEIGELREGARQLLLAIAQLNTVKTKQQNLCSTLFLKLKTRFANYSLLGAADTTGRVFCSSEPVAYSTVAHQPFFERAMAQPGLAVGNYWVDPVTGLRTIHFAERFEDDDGHVTGVVFAGLNLEWLSDHLKERGLPPTASVLIADREGNIIARLPHPELLVGRNMRKSHEAIMDGDKAGWEESIGVDGATRIYGYVPPALPPKDFFLSAGLSRAEAFAAIDSATRRGIALILAGLLAAIYAAWAGGRNFIRRPIEDLLAVTAEWRNGNFNARAHLADRSSEIARLGAEFNAMADALVARHAAQQRAEAELRELNTTLESRIEQRTIELEGAIRAKSQFLANMSHEIRTPLNGVVGMLELLRQTELAPTQRRFVETARRSSETLLGVINGVLDLSKIEAGRVELEESAFDLRTVVEEVTELFAELAYGKGLELSCFVPASLRTGLVGDAGRLRQVLTNLISNAIKFTDRGEVAVRVALAEQDSSSALLTFEVIDTGIGIPAEKREHIFEAFAQADSSTTRRYGGTGLGLSIAKHFCQMMGGTIEVTSELGGGSTFRFTAHFSLQPQPDVEVELDASPCRDISVLVVADNVRIREILGDHLAAWHIPIQQTRTASAALAMLRDPAARQNPLGVVIIDSSLADMAGFELARAISRLPAASELRVVLAISCDQDVRELGDGALKLLTKPIRRPALWDCIAGVEANTRSPIPCALGDSSRSGPEDAPVRVLLVEDSPINLEVGVAVLESMGCIVETAANGLQALERHAGRGYELIFMDCQMPEMDGFETTIEIRRREARSGQYTPIIALTASVVEDGRQRCLAVGMDDFLAKPFTLQQIGGMLTTWLRARRYRPSREHFSLVANLSTRPDPIDEEVLDSLRHLQQEGRPDLVRQVIELFLKGAAGLLCELDQAAASSDVAQLYHASHALKSASANIGAVVLSSCCHELEALAKAGSVPDAVRRVAAIREAYLVIEGRLSGRLQQVA
jgi:signal transduction histidine kinase/CheY-like chemotaxis protein